MSGLDAPCFQPEELQALAEDPASLASFGPWTETPALLVEAAVPLPSGHRGAALAQWLAQLPCPSLALLPAGQSAPPAGFEAFDAVAANAEEAATMLVRIRRQPLAAATAVRLLRQIDGLPLEPALQAESLAFGLLQAGPEHRAWLGARRGKAADDGAAADRGEPAVLCQTRGDTLQLLLNRPRRGNALSVEMRDALCEALRRAQSGLASGALAAVTMAARGAHFCTGGDLDEFGTLPDPVTAHIVRGLALPGRLLAACAGAMSVTVHGRCIGSGIEMPAFAGRLVARRDAVFQLPELDLGLIPGAGGCVSIPRRIGRQKAAWMLLSGQPVDAETALRWGLVDAIG